MGYFHVLIIDSKVCLHLQNCNTSVSLCGSFLVAYVMQRESRLKIQVLPHSKCVLAPLQRPIVNDVWTNNHCLNENAVEQKLTLLVKCTVY